MSFVVCATNAANYLTFTAEEENSSFNINVSGDDPDVQYSLDEGITWTPLKSFIRVKLENKGDKALLKGDNPSGFSTIFRLQFNIYMISLYGNTVQN